MLNHRVEPVAIDANYTHGLHAGIVLRGIYMGSLILGATRQDAFGYTFVAAALNALRFALSGDAETVGVGKKGQVFFVAFPLLVALGSFATLEPSELLSP